MKKSHAAQLGLSPQTRWRLSIFFFKSIYPNIARFFQASFDCESLHISNKLFFSNENHRNIEKNQNLDRINKNQTPSSENITDRRLVFVPDPRFYSNLVVNKFEEGKGSLKLDDITIFVLEIVAPANLPESGLARLTIMEPQPEYFLEQSSIRSFIEFAHNEKTKKTNSREFPTEIHEGIYYSTAKWTTQFNEIEGFIALRDIVTRIPLVERCSFSPSTVKSNVFESRLTLRCFGSKLYAIRASDRIFRDSDTLTLQKEAKNLIYSATFYKSIEEQTGAIGFSDVY